MYVDNEAKFSDAQSVIINDAAFGYSTNWFDLARAGEDIGNGTPLYLVVTVTTALVGAATLDIAVLSDAVDAVSDSGSTIHGTLGKFAAAATVGTTLVMPLGPLFGSSAELLQYMSVRYGAVGANITAGAVDAFITSTPYSTKLYANNITIS